MPEALDASQEGTRRARALRGGGGFCAVRTGLVDPAAACVGAAGDLIASGRALAAIEAEAPAEEASP